MSVELYRQNILNLCNPNFPNPSQSELNQAFHDILRDSSMYTSERLTQLLARVQQGRYTADTKPDCRNDGTRFDTPRAAILFKALDEAVDRQNADAIPKILSAGEVDAWDYATLIRDTKSPAMAALLLKENPHQLSTCYRIGFIVKSVLEQNWSKTWTLMSTCSHRNIHQA